MVHPRQSSPRGAREAGVWKGAAPTDPASSSRSSLLVEHDLFRKPVPTFRDHALDRIDLGIARQHADLGRGERLVLGNKGRAGSISRLHRVIYYELMRWPAQPSAKCIEGD